VLKISHDASLHGVVILRLEGQVKGPWVEKLRRLCDQCLATRNALALDLTEVSFLDRGGVALCRRLQDRHVALLHCSPFIVEQLKG
jgi:hypothetical protein